MTPNAPDNPPRLQELLSLFAQYQRRLYLYILSMLPNPADAEDVLQETNIVVWKKFDSFQPGTDFRAWVFQIALLEVHKFRQRPRNRTAGVTLSNEVFERLAAEYPARESLLETRQDLLARCIAALPDSDRTLVDHVYGGVGRVTEIAQQAGRDRTSVYRSLRRIRRALLDCVERGMAREAQV